LNTNRFTTQKKSDGSTAIYGDIYQMPIHGVFSIEIAGGSRICRGHSRSLNCKNFISKGQNCLTEKYLNNQYVGRGKTRMVYKKLSYCPICAQERINYLYKNIQKEYDVIKQIKTSLDDSGLVIKSGRYALLLNKHS